MAGAEQGQAGASNWAAQGAALRGRPRPRWRKVLADLWINKTRTLLVVASIAVGVFAIGAIATEYAILSTDIRTSYAAAQPANIAITTEPFDEALVETVRKLPGVLAAEGRLVLPLRASGDGVAWKQIQIQAMREPQAAQINLLTPIGGRPYPEARELVVREDFLNSTGLEPGDEAQLMLPDGTIRRLPVVGQVGDQYAAGKFALPPSGYVTLETAPWLGGYEGFNRLFVRVAEGEDAATIDAVAAAVEEQLRDSGREIFETTTNRGSAHPLAGMLLAIVGVLGVLGVLIMLLSASLIFNTLNALLRQQRRQIGMMKLVGGRERQIAAMYAALILLYGLLALLLAVVPGILAGYHMAIFLGEMMSIDIQGFRVVPAAIILQVALALAVPLIAGYVPVRGGARLSVRRALSEETPALQGAGGGVSGLRLPWLSRPLRLSIRNTFRQRGRLALTLFTLTMAGAIFIAVFNVRDSLGGFLDTLSQLYLADVNVTLVGPARETAVARAISAVPGVVEVEGWGFMSANVLDEDEEPLLQVYLMAPPAGSAMVAPEIVAGRWLRAEDGRVLAVSDTIWDTFPDFQPGDSLRVELPGERAETWPVVGIFRFIDMTGIDLLGYTNYETVAAATTTPGQATMFRVVAEAETMAEQQALGEALDVHLRALGYHIADIEAGQVTQRQQTQALNILVAFLLAMAVLTAVVGSIGLAGTMGMNVLERTREIGVMRAIGAQDREIVKAVVVEGLVIGLISFLLAVLLSFPISYALLRIISTAILGTVMRLQITATGFAIWLAVVALLAVGASLWPARNAARLTIREVLAYE